MNSPSNVLELRFKGEVSCFMKITRTMTLFYLT